MTFIKSAAVEALVSKYFPQQLPEVVFPEKVSKGKWMHYDFPSKYGTKCISKTFEDEIDIRKNIWIPNIKEGDVVFDIGADSGSYTLPAIAHGAYVVAVTPENYDYLIHNINLNGWLVPDKCLPIEAAFYSADGYLEFMRQVFAPTEHPNAFKVTTMDKMFKDWDNPIDLMKIDVEGAEIEVLHGATELIKRTKPKMLIECHEFKGGGITNEIMKLVDGLKLGYTWNVVDRRATKFIYFST